MKNKVLIIVVLAVLIVGGIIFVLDPFCLKGATNTVKMQKSNEEYGENLDSDLKKEDSNVFTDDIVGKWNAISAISAETGEKITNLRDIFGSSYSQYGSYLNLKNDGTFVDAIEPITDGSKATTGTYEVKRDYNKSGDCYVFLTYSDGTGAKLQKVILDDSNSEYLVLEEFINGYQITFKK